jgi:hypothetical protein
MCDDGRQRLEKEILETARVTGANAEPYLSNIRRATSRFAVQDAAPDDVRLALLAVEDHTNIDVDVPTGSRMRGARLVKLSVKRLTGWYVRYLGQQVTLMGQATVRLGAALVQHTERLEESSRLLTEEVRSLAARVELLERQERESPRP